MQIISQELIVMGVAMLPLSELQAAIPLGIAEFGFSIEKAIFLAWLGNLVPVLLILNFLEPVSKFLRKHSKQMDRFFTWLFARTRSKFVNKYESWGEFALLLFVALPGPGSGGWSASLGAWLLGYNKKKSFLVIAFGLLITASIITIVTKSAQWVVRT